ncbi:MAG: rRNA pseudouridine synthase [Clostridia bacterium]|nr:rRNA pseudouridine synthase [Clostridia bacterium]
MRLDRMLVTLGAGSRSEVQRLVRSGAVTVEGSPVRDPSAHVEEKAAVTLNGQRLDTRLSRTVMLYKPAGILTAARDPRQPTVMDLLPDAFRALGCMPVGRLDKDTTGLLLLTTDGILAHRLLSPARHVDKRYRAAVDGPLGEAEIGAFAAGLTLSDFTAQPALLTVESSSAEKSVALVTVHEGKFHQVRRMFAAVGREVTELHRERFGPLALDPDLQPGGWRDLTEDELQALRAAVE